MAVDPNLNDTEELSRLWAKINAKVNRVNANISTMTQADVDTAMQEIKSLEDQYADHRRSAAASAPKVLKALRWLGLSAQDAKNLYATHDGTTSIPGPGA